MAAWGAACLTPHVQRFVAQSARMQAQQVKLPKDVSGAAFAMLGQYAYGSQPQLMTDASLDRVQMSTKAIGKPWSTVCGE